MSDDNTPKITITDTARKRFLDVIGTERRQDQGLRVTVRNGGTYQPEFALNFVAPDEDTSADVVVDAGDLKIYADAESARWLDEASIDFIDTLAESGFKVDAPNSAIPTPTGPVAEAVRKVLDDKINPAVATHGGHVSLVAAEDSTAYLKFGGGCQGCGMVNVTLKQGVEKVLFADVPGITKVMDITDHAAGTNPYYQPGK